MNWNYSYIPNGALSPQPIRMGIYTIPCGGTYARVVDKKQYELKDHLGNVRVTFSDLKEPVSCSDLSQGWSATAMSVNNYYSGGSLQPGRYLNSDHYRFGFNGQENDNEITGIPGTHTTAMFWEYDARLMRRWNVDPVVKDWESPYACFRGNPIYFADYDGLDGDHGGPGHRKYRLHKVKNRNTPSVRVPGKGIFYWLTDLYNSIFKDNAAHKVRVAGRYVTSPWTQVPQIAQNGQTTTHVFSGPQYNPSDYRLRNVRINVTSNNPLNVFAIWDDNGIPFNFGAGWVPYNLWTNDYSYGFTGALSGLFNQFFWTFVNSGFAASARFTQPGFTTALLVMLEVLNVSRVKPIHRNTNRFKAYSNSAGGPTTHTVAIRYRMWQAGAPMNIIKQFIRRILYGQTRQ